MVQAAQKGLKYIGNTVMTAFFGYEIGASVQRNADEKQLTAYVNQPTPIQNTTLASNDILLYVIIGFLIVFIAVVWKKLFMQKPAEINLTPGGNV